MGTKGTKVKREEQKVNIEKEGTKKRGVRRGGRGDRRKRRKGDEKNELKLIYNNIGGQSRKMWTEATEMIQKEKFDILALTETHWREEQKGQNIQGYRRFRVDRGGDAKKGGGIAVFVRQGRQAYQWEGKTRAELSLVAKENIWIILEGEVDLAVGVIYMASGQNKSKNEWNRDLFEKVDAEIEELQEAGKEIFLVGDFNGHVEGKKQEGGSIYRGDMQGKRMQEAWERWKLTVINWTDKCEGKWTRMRNMQKSVIDYGLIQESCESRIKWMKIDDMGVRGIQQSDHNWIEFGIHHDSRKPRNEGEKERVGGWRIQSDTNWGAYKEELEKGIEEWWKEVGMEESGDVGVAYRKLVECMLTAADRTIGKKTKVGGGKERGLSLRQKKLIASRNQAGKEWRKECVIGGERVEAKWKQFLRKKVLVARNWQKDRRRRRIKWRIKSLGKGKGHIKEIWRDLKVGKTGGGDKSPASRRGQGGD